MSSGFISETDIAQRRKLRQENWEKTRGESDPKDAPEEPESFPDHRSLYEKLQEQKQKKQDDWEEAHKLKNMVRGLEDDEVDFLDLVDRTKLKEEQRVKNEEQTALLEYRKKVAEMNLKSTEVESNIKELEPKKTQTSTEGKKVSQMSLLAGAIKRKRSDDTSSDKNSPDKDSKSMKTDNGNLKCIAILPGIGMYTDSSDSDSNSSEDEPFMHGHKRDLTGRVLESSGSGGCGGQAKCC